MELVVNVTEKEANVHIIHILFVPKITESNFKHIFSFVFLVFDGIG